MSLAPLRRGLWHFQSPVLALALLTIFMVGCDNGNGNLGPNCDFDLAGMQANYADNIIIPAYQTYQDEVESLNTAVASFKADPSETNFQAVRDAWKVAYLAYQDVAPLEFGPAADLGYSLAERSNVFPTSPLGIEDAISMQNLDLDNSFKSVVGFPAVEYLLYNPNAQDVAALVAQFSTDAGADQRVAYLEALVGDLLTKANQMVKAWTEDGYDNTFKGSTGSADGSALALLANSYNFDYETLKNFKFKLPLGKLDGGIIQPQKVEGFYSGISLELAIAQAEAFERMYAGKSTSGQDGLGFEDYLQCLKTGEDTEDGLLAIAITEQFTTIVSGLKGLTGPLTDALENNKAAVDAVHDEMQKMVPLIKREMTAAMGVKISYVDNDGD
ncbi:MAG: imelysin family protein [Bacteroidota bacterium]